MSKTKNFIKNAFLKACKIIRNNTIVYLDSPTTVQWH